MEYTRQTPASEPVFIFMNTIYITKNDYKKLIDLINDNLFNGDHVNALLVELKRAEIVDPHDVPSDVITMNSLAVFSDIVSNEMLEYSVVFPEEIDISQKKISVFSPIGCALLGYRIGDTISVQTPQGEKKLKVEKILYQPESHGNYE